MQCIITDVFRTTERWIPNVPKCLRECTKKANELDGCAYDDFVCHCINYQKYSDVSHSLFTL
jgi:hypothetical protein